MRQQVTDKILQVSVSPKFMAILDCLLRVEEPRTDPALETMVMTSDGHLMGQHLGDAGYNDYLASAVDLYRNLRGVGEVAGLTPEEQVWLTDRANAL